MSRHILILDKTLCSGCSACEQICPKSCITFRQDKHGFNYPEVNKSLCVECGACVSVCPFHNLREESELLASYAAVNHNEEIRAISSSGGIFYQLALKTIQAEGVVFGVRFNENWQPCHTYAFDVVGLRNFLASKYVQSNVGNAFREVKGFLDKGIKVLFSGTPCQVAGLNNYLKKDYRGLLITVEVICHGVPSPGIWSDYLRTYHNPDAITGISFRDKSKSWESFNLKISNVDGSVYCRPMNQDPYVNGFLKNLYLRPSCYNCKTKKGKSHADITLGDFWGINHVRKELNDHKGVSLVITHNGVSDKMLKSCDIDLVEVNAQEAIKYNPAYTSSVDYPIYYGLFWKLYQFIGIRSLRAVLSLYGGSFPSRVVNKILSTIIRAK